MSNIASQLPNPSKNRPIYNEALIAAASRAQERSIDPNQNNSDRLKQAENVQKRMIDHFESFTIREPRNIHGRSKFDSAMTAIRDVLNEIISRLWFWSRPAIKAMLDFANKAWQSFLSFFKRREKSSLKDEVLNAHEHNIGTKQLRESGKNLCKLNDVKKNPNAKKVMTQEEMDILNKRIKECQEVLLVNVEQEEKELSYFKQAIMDLTEGGEEK